MKLSTIFERAVEIVLDPNVPSNAYFGAIERAAHVVSEQAAAEQFAEPYVNVMKSIPQAMERGERALLFGFLSEIAKQEGK